MTRSLSIRVDLDPLRFSASVGLNKIRLSGALAQSLQWPTDVDEFECWGVFTALGELLCASARDDRSSSLAGALQHRDNWLERSDLNCSEIAAAAFAAHHRVFNFTAKWLKSSNQLDLKLGSIPLFFLGWKDKESTAPIFPAVRDSTLVLYSQARFEQLLASSDLT